MWNFSTHVSKPQNPEKLLKMLKLISSYEKQELTAAQIFYNKTQFHPS